MFDPSISQAAGLQSPATMALPRLVVVACHGDAVNELPLVWELCQGLAAAGDCSVAILDGTSSESATQPGLLQMLQFRRSPAHQANSDARCLVIPSALGLTAMVAGLDNPAKPLQLIGQLTWNTGLVIAYVDVPTLTSLFKGTGVEPVLPVAMGDQARLTAYKAFKSLIQVPGIRPPVALVRAEVCEDTVHTQEGAISALQDCTMYFLSHHLEVISLPSVGDRRISDDLPQFAMRIFERAVAFSDLDEPESRIEKSNSPMYVTEDH